MRALEETSEEIRELLRLYALRLQQPELSHTELIPPLNQHRQAEDPEEVSASLRQPLSLNPISVDSPASVVSATASTIHRVKKMATCFIGCAHSNAKSLTLPRVRLGAAC